MWNILWPQVIWIPALIGLGRFLAVSFKNIASQRELSRLNAGELGLLGIVLLTCGATLLNFVMPIVYFSPVALAWGWYHFTTYAYKNENRFASHWRSLSLFFVLFLAMVSATRYGVPTYDAGQYHIPASLWTRNHVFPLGYGNLNEFIGYNSSWFIFGAALSLPFTGWAPLFTAESMAILFFVYSLILAFFREKDFKQRAFAVIALALLLFLGIPAGAGTNSNDHALILFGLGALYYFLKVLTDEKNSLAPILLVAFVTFAISVKLSAVPLALSLLFVRNRKLWLPLGGTVAAVLLPWMLRGLLGTGCLAYPAHLSCVPGLPWSVPQAQAIALEQDIKMHAGNCLIRKDVTHCLTEELLPTLIRTREIQIPLFCGLLGLLGILIQTVWKGYPSKELRGIYPLILVGAAGLAYWFILAPHPRFGLTFTIGMATILGTAGASVFAKNKRIVRAGYWLLVLSFMLWGKRILMLELHSRPFMGSVFPKIPKFTSTLHLAKNGESYFTATRDTRCWDIPVPCATDSIEDLVIEQTPDGRYSITRTSKTFSGRILEKLSVE